MLHHGAFAIAQTHCHMHQHSSLTWSPSHFLHTSAWTCHSTSSPCIQWCMVHRLSTCTCVARQLYRNTFIYCLCSAESPKLLHGRSFTDFRMHVNNQHQQEYKGCLSRSPSSLPSGWCSRESLSSGGSLITALNLSLHYLPSHLY